jgi:Transposase DDE domain
MHTPPLPIPQTLLDGLLAGSGHPEISRALGLHARAVPLGLLVRVLLERLFHGPAWLPLFGPPTPHTQARADALQALAQLMIQVSAGSRASLFAAYQADQASDAPTINTTASALYEKLGHISPDWSASLVRFSAVQLQPLLELLPPAHPPRWAGGRTRILDGNALAKTDHRLEVTRRLANGCLPGKSVVVYEPDLGLVTDVVLAEDAYAQERVLARELLPRGAAGDLWIGDRHFCTAPFAFGVARSAGFFLVRQHQSNLPVEPLEELRSVGVTATGTVFEQRVRMVETASGETREVRRIEVRLHQRTRNQEWVVALVTNLPADTAAATVAELYRQRWKIETAFQFLTESLHCELPSLGTPRAALFVFAMALIASNALAVVRGALRGAHGVAVEGEISGYYLAEELGPDLRVLGKYLPGGDWAWCQLPAVELVPWLTAIAGQVNVKALRRHCRGPKRPKPKRRHDRKHSHYSTHRLKKAAENSS